MKKVLVIVSVLLLAAGSAALACGSKADVTGCSKSAESIQRTMKKIDNGVQIMLASDNAEMVAQIQEKGGECRSCCGGDCVMKGEGVTRVVQKTANGVTITATSANPEIVKALQTHATAAKDGGCPLKKKGNKQAKGGCMFDKVKTAIAAAL
ncbi:MAG: hypothetical protein OEQ13_10600 [Acidobacteriota bacterium]|nr:hypothetical protein [Acidobacteriota bacterium]